MVGVGNRVSNSQVWAYFSKKTDGGNCNQCGKLVKGKGGNTSNLDKHLRLKHNISLKKCTLFESAKSSVRVPQAETHDGDAVVSHSTSHEAAEASMEPDSDRSLPPLPKFEPYSAFSVLEATENRKRPVQMTLTECVQRPLKRRKISEDEKNEINRAITRYIVKDMQPFSTIANEPFRRVLKALNPEYIPPNRDTLSTTYIPAWYDVELTKLKEDLSSVSGVGITADHWTSLNGDHYLTVTAQYLKDWLLHSKVLKTKAVYESQTGEAIEHEIRDILVDFGLSDKVVGITVDNAANMAAGARLLNILRIPCFAHSMNISASKLYNDASFTKWLSRIRSVVVWFKRVHMAGVVLKEKLKNLELPNHTVILDVKTRWNSMFLMVERFAEIYPALSSASRDPRLKTRIDTDKVSRLTDEDLKKAEEFVDTMKILYTSTLAISTDKLPTVGQVLPTWCKLSQTFAVKDDDSVFIKQVKLTVWRDMQKRYQDPELVTFLEEASALDPRFKNKAMDEVWGRLESKVADMIQRTASYSQEVKVKVESDVPNAMPSQCSTSEGLELSEESGTKRKMSAIEELFADDDDDVLITKIDDPPTPQMLAHSEIKEFRNMPKMKMSENPMDFYKIHSQKFPMVSVLACQYFCVSGSSVPSERVFSLAGNTISQERVRIDPEKADMLIFLHKNAD